jgi:hypothetical protein
MRLKFAGSTAERLFSKVYDQTTYQGELIRY